MGSWQPDRFRRWLKAVAKKAGITQGKLLSDAGLGKNYAAQAPIRPPHPSVIRKISNAAHTPHVAGLTAAGHLSERDLIAAGFARGSVRSRPSVSFVGSPEFLEALIDTRLAAVDKTRWGLASVTLAAPSWMYQLSPKGRRPDKLRRLESVLRMPVADLYISAGYLTHADLAQAGWHRSSEDDQFENSRFLAEISKKAAETSAERTKREGPGPGHGGPQLVATLSLPTASGIRDSVQLDLFDAA